MKPGGKYSGLGDRARLLGIPVWEPSDHAELERIAAGIIHRRPALVVVAGGDGTLRDVASALYAAASGLSLPELLFLPAGTVSTVVRNLQSGRAGGEPALESVLGGERLQTRQLPTLLLELSDGRRLVGFIVGAGLVSRFFEEYQRHGSRGLGSAARIAVRVFAGSLIGSRFTASLLAPMPCAVVADGVTQSASAFSLVACAVVRDLGLHFLVNYRAGEDPGRPHLVACPLPAFALGRQAFRVLRGQPLRAEGAFDGLITSAEIRFDAESPIVIDGDLYITDWVRITAGPRLQVCV